MLKDFFKFFLFSSIYIGVCAVVMACHTYFMFQIPASTTFLLFVFAGTLCSYNFHWYLTPALYGHSEKVRWSYHNKKLHAVLFFIGLAGAAYFGYRLLEYWDWLLVTAFITFLYSAPKIPFKAFHWLKQIALGKTIFLAYAWTHITAFLPITFSGTDWTIPHYLFVINRFFLIYPICILFDYRDREEDKKEGIRSMITEFNEAGVNIIFWGSLGAFFVTTVLLFIYGISLWQTILLTLPGLILASLYSSSKNNLSDYHYYFVLDGLMMLSGLLLLIFQF